MLRDLVGNISGDNKTKIDRDICKKYVSLDVKKVATKILIFRMNRLILMSKLKPERQKNTAVILLEKVTFQWYWKLIVFFPSNFEISYYSD